MTAKRAIIGLAASFVLWVALEAVGVGLSLVWYLAFCSVWIFAPWVWQWIKERSTREGREIVAGYLLLSIVLGVVIGGLVALVAPWWGVVVGVAWAVLTFGVLCIAGTAE